MLSDLGQREESLEALSEAVETFCDLSEKLPGAFLGYLHRSWTNFVRQIGEENARSHPIAGRAAALLRKREKNEE